MPEPTAAHTTRVGGGFEIGEAVFVRSLLCANGGSRVHDTTAPGGDGIPLPEAVRRYQDADDRHENFPGGVVDLRYRFTLRDDLISELVIAP